MGGWSGGRRLVGVRWRKYRRQRRSSDAHGGGSRPGSDVRRRQPRRHAGDTAGPGSARFRRRREESTWLSGHAAPDRGEGGVWRMWLPGSSTRMARPMARYGFLFDFGWWCLWRR
ncbi:extensin [Iris pallida]|uniref:Extensin n=1 Tax=Iris pallida TaxID=29817 RepID=A0AAX6DPV0_IRIPA|nr:extensin [Iris pallida]